MATLKPKKPKARQDSLKIAHGKHVNKGDFQLQGMERYHEGNHNFKDHIGYDPSGKPVTYRDVPIYNSEGGALPLHRNNEGMIRREYHMMNNSMHQVYGFPDTEAGRAEYQKLRDKYGLE